MRIRSGRASSPKGLVVSLGVFHLVLGAVPGQVSGGGGLFRVVDFTRAEHAALEGAVRGAHAGFGEVDEASGRPARGADAGGDSSVEDGSDGLRVTLGSSVLGGVVQVADVRDRDRGDDADDGDDDEHFHEGETGFQGGQFNVFHSGLFVCVLFGCWVCSGSQPRCGLFSNYGDCNSFVNLCNGNYEYL